MDSHRKRIGGWLSLACAVCFAVAPASETRAAGDRLVVVVPEPFEVSGVTYPAGVLAVRHIADFNPGIIIDEVTVGFHRVGMLLAQKQRLSAEGPGNAIIFWRDRSGRLVLVGYSMIARGASQLFVYDRGRDPSDVVVAGGTLPAEPRRVGRGG